MATRKTSTRWSARELRGGFTLVHLFVPHVFLIIVAAILGVLFFASLGFWVGLMFNADGDTSSRNGWIGEAIWIGFALLCVAKGAIDDGSMKRAQARQSAEFARSARLAAERRAADEAAGIAAPPQAEDGSLAFRTGQAIGIFAGRAEAAWRARPR